MFFRIFKSLAFPTFDGLVGQYAILLILRMLKSVLVRYFCVILIEYMFTLLCAVSVPEEQVSEFESSSFLRTAVWGINCIYIFKLLNFKGFIVF